MSAFGQKPQDKKPSGPGGGQKCKKNGDGRAKKETTSGEPLG